MEDKEQEEWLRDFNSRPHEEVDSSLTMIRYNICDISTHDLTRRSTVFDSRKEVYYKISTHDLTRRSTVFLME